MIDLRTCAGSYQSYLRISIIAEPNLHQEILLSNTFDINAKSLSQYLATEQRHAMFALNCTRKPDVWVFLLFIFNRLHSDGFSHTHKYNKYVIVHYIF